MNQSVSALEARWKFGKIWARESLRRESIIIELANKKLPRSSV